ncbi:MAG: DMT family transporter [Bacteroidales bacterium]|nr:DMT family transporter [Bacteroidales bacterium]
MNAHWGEIAALIAAAFWTVTALVFEAAGRKIGSLVLNLLRLILGFLFLSTFTLFYRGYFFPIDATTEAWFYLFISGLVGFVIGDLCLFQAFVMIGARISMLIMSLAPPITALISWIILGETLTLQNWLGMIVTMAGISIVVLKKADRSSRKGMFNRFRVGLPVVGLLLALGGAFGQATGLVLSKFGMQQYDAFAASQIRILAGIAGFVLIFTFLRRWRDVFLAFTFRKAMLQMSVGSFFGPFLGVSFSLIAVKYASAGVAATLMSIVPVLIIAPSAIFLKEKITIKEIIGAIIAVGGVALFFL